MFAQSYRIEERKRLPNDYASVKLLMDLVNLAAGLAVKKTEGEKQSSLIRSIIWCYSLLPDKFPLRFIHSYCLTYPIHLPVIC